MPNFPRLAIGVITFNRPNEIRATIAALVQQVRYAGEVVVIVSDDSTPGPYRRDLEYWWQETYPRHPWQFKTMSTAKNGGWGRATNGLLREVFEVERVNYLLQIEDDYIAHTPIDLNVGVAVMEQEPALGMLRYRATAGAPMHYAQRETDIHRWCPEYREYWGYTQAKVTWLELLSTSETLWLYSNGVHLKRPEFHGVYGLYPEGLKLGMTEEQFAHNVLDIMRAHPHTPKIGIQPEFVLMKFDHVGVSYQGTEYDK